MLWNIVIITFIWLMFYRLQNISCASYLNLLVSCKVDKAGNNLLSILYARNLMLWSVKQQKTEELQLIPVHFPFQGPLYISMFVKTVHGITLPIISLLVCKEAFLSRNCNSDFAVKCEKSVKVSNLMINFSGWPISNTLTGFTHTEKSFIQ